MKKLIVCLALPLLVFLYFIVRIKLSMYRAGPEVVVKE